MDDEGRQAIVLRRERVSNALPALLLALDLVLVALILTRPWERSPVGPVAQVAPSDPALALLSTGPAIGELAPNFVLADIDGRQIELASLRDRPVLLNFWATWCIYCTAEMPALQVLADETGSALTLVGVNVGEAAEDARRFAEMAKITYPLVLDTAADVARSYHVPALPTTVLVDGNGVVVSYWYGPISPADVRAAVMLLLAETPLTTAGADTR